MFKVRTTCFILLAVFCLAAVSVAGCGQTAPGDGPKNLRDTEEVSAKTAVQPPAVKNLTERELSLLPPDIRRIKEKGRLTVAMFRQDRPPFFYNDDSGRLAGIDAALARDIARWLEVDVVFDRQAGSFDEVVDRVASGQADLAVSKLSVTLSRAQKVRYTQPYTVFKQALLVNRMALAALEAKHPDGEPLDLIINAAQKIGVRENTSYVEYGRNLFPHAEIISFTELEELIAAVQEGTVPAAFYDEFELRNAIDKNPSLSIYAKLFVIKDRVDPIAMAVAPEDGQLLAWLNLYLDIMKQDLQIDQQLAEYSGGAK
ncbi:ABC transporter substrate-binding protein [Pelotomaculum terephthalicicum JT]|uniref:ABC transporter substrate-binding protein n=1 Tax=Pelotomaculum TaxID=191373 RepID=UPI0009C91902|nr:MULTISPECIES: ABC transporter substrate-binding protein [Pelotomaculum]MCG9966577.1 ABC transporter substrate-binding protein [Pelotomaculum terephthalicicum JT]OPX92337.1 MAG: ABC transporter arginine-binding protein 1 precursor [Pelotomaculum sp. PtaB.Bin117]OPY63515.1 MAG: ABC transporter arginine-binding protein 1 precursor [Pelotomaculum sp. PtaU1.Bin065]